MFRPYQNHTHIPWITVFGLLEKHFPKSIVSRLYNIHPNTLASRYKNWVQKCKPDYKDIERRGGHNKILTSQQEQQLYEYVQNNINNHDFINDKMLIMYIKEKYKIEVSSSVVTLFKRKNRLSSVRPSYAKQGQITEFSYWMERYFLRRVFDLACEQEVDEDTILNFDETFLRRFPFANTVVIGNTHTIICYLNVNATERICYCQFCMHAYLYDMCDAFAGNTNAGRQGRVVNTDIDVKQGITCMVTIALSGKVLPPLFVKAGKTQVCIDNMELDKNICVTNSVSGWVDEDVMLYFIDNIILPYLGEREGHLILDCFAAHISQTVKQHCKDNNINLIFVPANMTWKRQPLDTHIFGPLKKQYQTEFFKKVYIENETVELSDAVEIFNKLTLNIKKTHIRNAFRETILIPAKDVPEAKADPRPENCLRQKHHNEEDLGIDKNIDYCNDNVPMYDTNRRQDDVIYSTVDDGYVSGDKPHVSIFFRRIYVVAHVEVQLRLSE
jgi:hypothetical protein